MMRRRRSRDGGRRRRGSVFVLVLLLSGLVAGLAASFAAGARLQLQQGRDQRSALGAELAAESGWEYALRRLRLDHRWRGTDGAAVALPDGRSFVVAAQGPAESLVVQIDGRAAPGLARYRLEVDADPGGASNGDKAVVFLGEQAEFAFSQVDGDVLLPDRLGAVRDWHNEADGGGWWGGDGRAPEPGEGLEYSFRWTDVHGTLWKFTDTVYLGGDTEEQVTEEPVKMPPWRLEGWLDPQPGVEVLTDVYELRNQIYDDTVVLVLTQPPPAHSTGHQGVEHADVHLDNCHFNAGLVVYAPWDTDLRRPAARIGFKQEITACNCVFGVPGGNHLGVLAPAAEIELENSVVRGLVYAREAEFELSDLWGVLIAVHELELEHAQVFFDPEVAREPPPGVELDQGAAHLALLEMAEHYGG